MPRPAPPASSPPAPEGVLLDRSVFYARAGGQPGDTGTLRWADGEMPVADTVKGPEDTILHLPGPGAALPPVGAEVRPRSTGRAGTATCGCIPRCTCCAA